jgi:hypothetical protein
MMSQCHYCGSPSYGYCSSSPSKVHEHNADGDHCEFCGSPSYGYCSLNPSKSHRHGPGKCCRYCGSSNSLNVDELDEHGECVATWCFRPEGDLPIADVMLAKDRP